LGVKSGRCQVEKKPMKKTSSLNTVLADVNCIGGIDIVDALLISQHYDEAGWRFFILCVRSLMNYYKKIGCGLILTGCLLA
jgi:hypothetical protein